jgi:protein O-GlcNAc transferase
LWCKVLNELPATKMLIGNVSDIELQKQLENEFSRRGVAVERLIFHAKKSIPDYLKLHGEVDFILDTFPYNGGTTTGFALGMGVPVLTLCQNSLAGRGGVVMLSLADLHHEFVTESETEFMEKAKKWCQSIEELQNLRLQLRERMRTSQKRRPEYVAAGLEKATRQMWQRFCAGLPAESFVVRKEG